VFTIIKANICSGVVRWAQQETMSLRKFKKNFLTKMLAVSTCFRFGDQMDIAAQSAAITSSIASVHENYTNTRLVDTKRR